MSKLNAAELILKRKEMLGARYKIDYDETVSRINIFFGIDDNLLKDNPTITVKPDLDLTCQTIAKDFTEAGFAVKYDVENKIVSVRLDTNDTETQLVKEAVVKITTEDTKVVPDVVVKTTESVAPVVTVEVKETQTPTQSFMNHSDFMMGGAPF